MTNKDREIIASRFKEIAAADKALTPSAVVKDARPPKSPLHQYFDWNDARVAQTARLERAREMIRAVHYYVLDDEQRRIECPVWVRDPDMLRSEQGYVQTAIVAEDPNRARRVLAEECQRAAAILRRVRGLAVGLRLAGEVDDAIRKLTGVVEAISRRRASKKDKRGRKAA